MIGIVAILPVAPLDISEPVVERRAELPPDSTIRLNTLTFSRTYVCTPRNNYLWMVTDRYDVVHDIDGNGLVDIPFTAANGGAPWPGYAYVAFQTSPGNFSCQAVSNLHNTPYGISVGDFNGDSRLDLVFSTARDNAAFTLRNNGGWSFTEQRIGSGGGFPNHIAIRNVDAGPGAEVLYTDEYYRLYQYSYTSSSLTTVNTSCKEGLAAEDLNGDSQQDVICGTGNAFSGGRIIYQIRTGSSWSSIRSVTSTSRYYHGVKAADINDDGRVDVVSCVGPTVFVWYNNGGTYPTFTERSYSVGSSSGINTCEVTIADLDCDGDGDIVWSQGYGGGSPSIVILINDGSTPYPNFSRQPLESGSYVVYGVAVGLVNNDRKADIIAGLNNALYIYYNTSPIDDSLCDPFGVGGDELTVSERTVEPIPTVADFRVEGRTAILELTAPSKGMEYALYEVSGRLVRRGKAEGMDLRLEVPRSGTYFLKVRYDRGHLDYFSKAFVVR